MRTSPDRSLILLLLVSFLMAVPGTARAQGSSGSIGIEVLKPSIDDTKMFNGAVFVSYTRRLSEAYVLEARVPVARFHKDSPLFEEEILVGNPYLGGVRLLEDSPVFFTAGMRLPIASAEKPFARLMGEYADLTRNGAFLPDAFAFEGTAGVSGQLENGVRYRGEAGPVLTLPSGDVGDSEFYLQFTASASYGVTDEILAGAGISGVYWLTAGSSPFDDLIYQGIAGLEYDLGSVRPGITLRLPLSEDWGDAVDGILGLHLAVPLP